MTPLGHVWLCHRIGCCWSSTTRVVQKNMMWECFCLTWRCFMMQIWGCISTKNVTILGGHYHPFDCHYFCVVNTCLFTHSCFTQWMICEVLLCSTQSSFSSNSFHVTSVNTKVNTIQFLHSNLLFSGERDRGDLMNWVTKDASTIASQKKHYWTVRSSSS